MQLFTENGVDMSHETTSGPLSHDMYFGPTSAQIETYEKLVLYRQQYADLYSDNADFGEAIKFWVEREAENGTETTVALSQLNIELESEMADLSKDEAENSMDAVIKKMVQLRLNIARLEADVVASTAVTGVNETEIQDALEHSS